MGSKKNAPQNLDGVTKTNTKKVENSESNTKKNKNKRPLEETNVADVNGQKLDKKKRQKKNKTIQPVPDTKTSAKAKKDNVEPNEKQKELIKHLTDYLEKNKLMDTSLQLGLKLIIKNYNNVPKREQKFRNFIKHSMKETLKEEQIDKVWEIFQEATNKFNPENGKTKTLNKVNKKDNTKAEKVSKKTVNKEKQSEDSEDEAEVDEQNGETPSKRQRKRKGSKKLVKQK